MLHTILPLTQIQTQKNHRAKQQTEVGKVVNLMSADITQIMTFCFPFLSQLLTAPLTIIGAAIFMITQIRCDGGV